MPCFNDAALNTLGLGGLTGAKFTTAALSGSTASAGDLTGAVACCMTNSGANPGTYTTRTAAQMIADAALQIGQMWLILLANAQGTGTLTLAGGTGVTISGTATMAINVGRIYVANITSPIAITITNLGSFTAP